MRRDESPLFYALRTNPERYVGWAMAFAAGAIFVLLAGGMA